MTLGAERRYSPIDPLFPLHPLLTSGAVSHSGDCFEERDCTTSAIMKGRTDEIVHYRGNDCLVLRDIHP